MSSILKVDTLQDVNGNAIISSDGSGNLTPNTFTALTVSGDLTVDTNTLYVDSANNRVGIGTSSPSTHLHVTGSSTAQLRGQNGAEYFELLNDSTNSIFSSTGPIFLRTNNADPLIFQYNISSESMRIDSSGNVGIGTSSPSSTLDVNGNLKAGNTIDIGLADTNNTIMNVGVGATGNKFAITDYIGDTTYTDYGLRVGRKNDGANGTSTLEHRGTGGLVLNAIDAGNIQLHTSNTERMRIDSSGNVGIGTTSPTSTLEVNGTISGKMFRTDVIPVLAQDVGSGVVAPTYSSVLGAVGNFNATGEKAYWFWYIPDDCNEIVSVDCIWFQSGNPTGANQGEINFTTRVVINNGYTVGTNTTSTLTLTNSSNGTLRENTIAGSTILPTQTPGRAVLIEGEFDFAVGGAGAYIWQIGSLVINWR